jgi:hypothetical protein
MALPDPKTVAEKWSRNLAGATDYIRQGVQRVTIAPSELAIGSKEKFKRRLIEAIDKGKWEAGLKRYSLDQWKKDMLTRGIDRIPSGADAAKDKMSDFYNQLFPHIEAGLKELERMPSMTLEDSVNRATYWIRHMAKFTKK